MLAAQGEECATSTVSYQNSLTMHVIIVFPRNVVYHRILQFQKDYNISSAMLVSSLKEEKNCTCMAMKPCFRRADCLFCTPGSSDAEHLPRSSACQEPRSDEIIVHLGQELAHLELRALPRKDPMEVKETLYFNRVNNARILV
jgi:hypothetical protein